MLLNYAKTLKRLLIFMIYTFFLKIKINRALHRLIYLFLTQSSILNNPKRIPKQLYNMVVTVGL